MQSLSPSGPAHLATRADRGHAVHGEQRSEGELGQGGWWLVTEHRGYESPVRRPGHSWHAPGLAPRKPQRVPGRSEKMRELMNFLVLEAGSLLACSGRGTETLGGVSSCWDIFLGHHTVGFQPYPMKACLLQGFLHPSWPALASTECLS